MNEKNLENLLLVEFQVEVDLNDGIDGFLF
jgi:hypothetical protein